VSILCVRNGVIEPVVVAVIVVLVEGTTTERTIRGRDVEELIGLAD
jgi:hypothetical protein